ncbi:putative F-box protein [Hibiscus syriacus]|uniref:F-box protein n=1 Tax=Hibiscus syriacus TaxID=106335 RepID=A0A6A3A8K7_HIBSY|nr:probable F-box protein At4g22030 [Hibiscus syriacus]KAE8700458.1 putative F-box protein [Hibiscus syriacus]
MASLQASNFLLSSSPSKQIRAALSVPKLPSIRLSVPKVATKGLSADLIARDGFINTIPFEKNVIGTPLVEESSSVSMATIQLHAILESIADRVEMHNNVGQQRENWNTLLLNSINMITLTAATMAGVMATGGAGVSVLSLKVASTLLFSAATGMLMLMNKIQPSQLVEEQRNATRLFKQLQRKIETLLSIGSPSKEDVKDAMENVLALDKAYPLPLLGVMLEKFPESLEPAVWWPKVQSQKTNKQVVESNGWSEELEMEMREVVEVIKRKDSEDYERLGNKALKMNKILAASGPILTGIAALGSAFMDSSNGPWAAAVAGALASAVNTLEHGGQVGMVFEMYRNNAGFFKHVQESIESTLSESELGRRENGELFEMKVALQLGRSLTQLRDVAKKSSYSRIEGSPIDEFASKLF